jgi:hypothetical protein
MACHVHDTLFDTMTALFADQRPALEEDGTFSVFYTAWFKQLATAWDLAPFMAFTRIGALEQFLANIRPPVLFLYYIQRFHAHVRDRAALSELFVECFIRPLVTYSIEYGLSSRLPDLNKPEFVRLFVEHPDYAALLDAFLVAEAPYSVPVLEKIDFEVQLTLTFLSQRPPPSEFLTAQVPPRWTAVAALKEPPILHWNTLKRTKWIVPIGTAADGADAFLIKPEKIPNKDILWDHVLFHFYYHFSDAMTPIDLFVDCRKITPAIVEKAEKFATNVESDFTDRVHRIVLLNITKASVAALSEFRVEKWLEKVVLIDTDLDGHLAADRVFLGRRYFPGPDGLDWIPATSGDVQLRIRAAPSEFIIRVRESLFDRQFEAVTHLPYSAVKVDYRDTICTIKFAGDSLVLETKAAKFLHAAWGTFKPLLPNTTPLAVPAASMRARVVALALSAIAGGGADAGRSLALYEAAIGGRGVTNCDVALLGGVPLEALVPDLVRQSLLGDVAMALVPTAERHQCARRRKRPERRPDHPRNEAIEREL